MRPVAEKVLVMLNYVSNQGLRAGQVLNEGWRYSKHLDRNTVLRYLNHEGIDERHDNWGLIEDLEEALKTESAEAGEDAGSLIEEIVKILQINYGRNVISGKNLHALRRLVLLPTEMAKLVDGMRKTLSCAGCGHQFTNRELTVFSPENENEGLFYCIRCLQPIYTTCLVSSDCDEAAQIPEGLVRNLIKASVCDKHKPTKQLSPDALKTKAAAENQAQVAAPNQIRFNAGVRDRVDAAPGGRILFAPRHRRGAGMQPAAPPPMNVRIDGIPDVGWHVVGQDPQVAPPQADERHIWGVPPGGVVHPFLQPPPPPPNAERIRAIQDQLQQAQANLQANERVFWDAPPALAEEDDRL